MKYKYLELKDLRTTGTIERVNCSELTKKELKYFLNLDLTNEDFEVSYEEYNTEQEEVYDYPWHIIRKNLNKNFQLKYPQKYEK